MIRRALLLSFAVVALLAAPASAQEEYDGAAGETAVLADGSIQVTGEGCPPNAAIAYDVTKDGAAFSSGSASADANGDFSFVVETDGAGEYQVAVTCGDETFVLNSTVGAAAPADTDDDDVTAAGTGALPTTGSDSSVPFAQLGIALVMIGGVAVYGAKRRRAKAFA